MAATAAGGNGGRVYGTPIGGGRHDGARLYGATGNPPACVAVVTTKDIEGPYFKAGAPIGNRMDLGQGVPFALTGRVIGADCRPLADATLEVWQADSVGRYDNTGFSYRTAIVTDATGAFRVRSVHPGHYKNGAQYRPAHIHVKVHHADHPPLTTQLYFAGDPYNEIDPWFDPSRALSLSVVDQVESARFDFVLA